MVMRSVRWVPASSRFTFASALLIVTDVCKCRGKILKREREKKSGLVALICIQGIVFFSQERK